jgi:3-methyladenine DNA glycosylase AlkD
MRTRASSPRTIRGVDARAAAREIEAGVHARGSPARAVAERRYLKSELSHLGTGVPGTRRVVAAFTRAHEMTRADVLALTAALWAAPVHERRLAAIELLRMRAEALEVVDLDMVERLIREARTWALVDPLATGVAGEILARDARAVDSLDRWADDLDLWLRRGRAARVAPPAQRGRTARTVGRYADAMSADKEFFIRKAIGWVLRDVSRARPHEVYAWLLPRAHALSSVTLKEAVKYLGGERAAEVLSRRSPG